MPGKFSGRIELDIRDSKADWDAFLDKRAPAGAPNVLVILYDDTGQAAWSPYGGRIQMPTLDKLAKNGLIYSQWHTTAVCSPTRSCFLTGRNHHANGFGCISEAATGFPGYAGHIPLENGTMASILRDAGWSTFWVGKNHNVPVDGFGMSASKKRWPLGLGYDRFYGFIGGETNQWYPELIEDNHFVDQPAQPEEGYHFSKDIADKAVSFIRDSVQCDPEKPWYMWYCPGANHAPHHAPQDYIDKYRGQFDDGYEAYREWALKRMIERGVLPADTVLTPINPLPADRTPPDDRVRPWDTLNADEKRLFSRMAEVFAAMSEYTDVQIGRVIDYLEESGQLDNTLIFYCADNGASGEGSPSGSVNENRFFNGYPDDVESNLAMIDKLGSPDTYNHYPTGWAVAFSTPYRMFKRYASYAGGTCDPLVVHWPKGIRAKGEVRHQYHHCTDIVPTILEACGVPMPEFVDGVKQAPLAGVSMLYSFDNAQAATTKKTQYYEMAGTRSIWNDGWKAATDHAPIPSDQGHFDKDTWQLFHTDSDRAEAHDLAAKHPERLEQLKALWLSEASRNNVLPLIDLGVRAMHAAEYHAPQRERYVYYPNTTEVPEAAAARTLGVSFKMLAEVDFTPESKGVIIAQGSRFGGYSLFVKDGKLFYVYNFLGITPEQQLVCDAPKQGRHVVGVEFVKQSISKQGEAFGTMTLHLDDAAMASAQFRTQTGRYILCGEGLCVGYDGGDAVSKEYKPQFPFTGGSVLKVVFDLADDAYEDIEQKFAAKLARD
ncbi:arylsulfatase [Stenotrophomonas terrae]|uniref:Arylsulfatase n=1 Tax=Stenotrophomonas terrae TaxID=405446 RepID=A0A0R0CDG9_9GAMM|nr:arylsulfatase [Stenotrophomonas terrae]KRG67727.1 arylsulfatase [Stenotrophomonas terrae]